MSRASFVNVVISVVLMGVAIHDLIWRNHQWCWTWLFWTLLFGNMAFSLCLAHRVKRQLNLATRQHEERMKKMWKELENAPDGSIVMYEPGEDGEP